MQLISESYKKLNEALHTTNAEYGVSGMRWVKDVLRLTQMFGTTDILDYGCGKSTFAQNFPHKIKQYDPAIEKYSQLPEPADIVLCSDVLEHIEPEMLNSVLDHLQSLVRKCGLFAIATRPAAKTLADGRNAHLIVEDGNWWLAKLLPRFTINTFAATSKEVIILVGAYEADTSQ